MSWMERSSSGRFGRGRMRMIGYPTAWLSSSCICLECQYVGLRGRSAKLERAHFTSKRVCTCTAFFFCDPTRHAWSAPTDGQQIKMQRLRRLIAIASQAAPEIQEMEIAGVGAPLLFPRCRNTLLPVHLWPILLSRRPSCPQRPWYMLPVDMHDDWVHVLHISW